MRAGGIAEGLVCGLKREGYAVNCVEGEVEAVRWWRGLSR